MLITEGALAVAEDEPPNLTQAALPGLLRSAHSEHPERFCLIESITARPSPRSSSAL